MTPTTPATLKVTRTVFDLTAFDDIKLVKQVTPPAKPTSLEEALAAVGNDKSVLLAVIYEGLEAKAREAAYQDINGFLIVPEDGEPIEEYTGKFADETKGKLINNAILALAKMNGFDKSLPKDKKAQLKENATQFLRDNPAMLASIQG